VAVAAGLFADRGFHGVSMREVADGAGLTKPGIYNFFAGKEDLFEAAVAMATDWLEEQVIDPARGIEDPVVRIRAMVTGFLQRFITAPLEIRQGLVLLTRDLVGLQPEHRAPIEQRLQRAFDTLREALDRLSADGRLSPDATPTASAFAIIGMVAWSHPVRHPASPSPLVQPAHLAEQALRSVLAA
jgi:AcrR family transcriptional regulator